MRHRWHPGHRQKSPSHAIGVRSSEYRLARCGSIGTRREDRVMQNFEQAKPTTFTTRSRCWQQVGRDGCAGGRTQTENKFDERIPAHAESVVTSKASKTWRSADGQGLRIGATRNVRRARSNHRYITEYPSPCHARWLSDGRHEVRRSANMGTVAAICASVRACWYVRRGFGLLGMQDEELVPTGAIIDITHFPEEAPALLRMNRPSSPPRRLR